MLRHVVFFKFKPETAEADIQKLERGLGDLPGTIPEILDYEFGRDVIRSERSYDFALVSSFADREALQRYQDHPRHQEVLKLVRSLCAGVVAVDYLTAEV